MRICLALASLGLFGCFGREVQLLPGSPELFAYGPWIQGASSEIHVEWPNFYQCSDDDWSGCRLPPSATMSIASLHCGGCRLLADPAGAHYVGETDLRAVATTDGPVEIQATLRFDGTGEERTLTASATGDHEVALQATCHLVDSETLAQALKSGGGFVGTEIRDCGTSRAPSDSVVIAPAVVTFHGASLFPFCLDGSNPCEGYSYHEQQRPRSTLSISVAPMAWGSSNTLPGFYFAVLPPLDGTPTIALSTPLATGELATTSVMLPPIAVKP